MKKQSTTVKVASWSAAHPWQAIVGWFLFVALCLGAAAVVGTNSATTEDYRVGRAGQAEALATEGGLERRPVEQVVIDSPSGPLDLDAARAAAADVTTRMEKLSEVDGVKEPVVSKDGKVLVVEVVMKGEELAARKSVDPLVAQTAEVQKSHPDVRVQETGGPSMSKGLDQQRSDDLLFSEMLTLPVTVITLMIAFGSVIAAGVPVLLAMSSIAAAMGLSALASHALPDAGVGNNIILLIGMAVGVDYSLFYLKRDREERARAGGRLGSQAIVQLAAETAGRTIVVSGLAVIVSTATLYLASDVIFSSLATGTIVVVLVAMASSLTVLPALLAKLGARSEHRAARRAEKGKRQRDHGGTSKVWQTMLRPATERPAITLVVSTLVMLALSAPALGLNLSVLGKDTFSRDIPAVQTYDRLTEAFPERLVQHQVVVRADTARSPQVAQALEELGERAQADPLFAKDADVTVRTSEDGLISSMTLSVPFKPSSSQALDSLDRVRDDFLPETVEKVDGAEAYVTGDIARDVDYLDHQNSKLPLIVGFLLLVTFLVTVAAFRSVVIGLIGIVLNLLSAAAAFGLLVVVFQGDWAQGVLDFNSTGAIGARVPLFLFVILFGLSMDYQVFVVSRIREAALRGKDTRTAVLEGIVSSAGVVTSAAVVMVTVFSSFIFLSLVEMKQMGFSLAVAVLLDAFIVRIMILPSALTLLGKASWWPSRGMRQVLSQPPGPTEPVVSELRQTQGTGRL
ncbi:MMPL family transporter [Streptomyces sp. JL1001]|uniref:MMPL family transporter n=1 Tax=Streptomyces sp. JL1001 TaxID=3078227 RepID=A0AAU8KFZ8_9ACTN|nr:MMPL family transporter [Streptomyces sp. Termitarium-T10T-6]SCD57118.1 putative drug exporter of the RND superfamily [Streptomyces sp. Termitarium-T10T-6]